MVIRTLHGSLDRSIDRFRTATHFGARSQALSAIGAKRFLDGTTHGLPTLYEVIIRVEDSHLHKVRKDWGKFGPQGALVALRSLMIEKDAASELSREIATRFNAHHIKINSVSCSEAAFIEAERILIAEGNGKFGVLTYDNDVEDVGVGYCVVDPSLISMCSITYPSWSEVIESFKRHNEFPKVEAEVEAFLSALGSRAA